MSRMRRYMIPLIVVACVLLMGWLFNNYLRSTQDNPVSIALAEFSANQYIKQNPTVSGYRIDWVASNEKNENYWVRLSLPGSADSYFELEYNHIGVLLRNTYENYVTKKWNTAVRLNNEYTTAMNAVLASAPKLAEIGCASDLSVHLPNDSWDSAHSISSDELELDGVYDLAELGARAGYVLIIVEVDSAQAVTVERLAETLLNVRKAVDQAGIPFYNIDCFVDYNNGTYSKYMRLRDFLYEDIYEENLERRVLEALDS